MDDRLEHFDLGLETELCLVLALYHPDDRVPRRRRIRHPLERDALADRILPDEEFGNERLEALLEQHIDYSASLIRDQIADAVDSFVGEAPQKDDETLVIVRRA